jgi:tetratricopeptide (TPR) repeat protein
MITGEMQLRLQFKYPPSWACVYVGVSAYENGEFIKAINCFTDAIHQFPGQYLLYGFRSAALTDAMKYTQAHADASKVIELQPNRAEGHLRLGNVLVACDDFVKAKEAYLTALKLEPKHDLTVEALREMDRRRKLSHLKKAVSDGREAFGKKAFDRAIKVFTEALELNPKNVSYLVYRALAHVAKGDIVSAQDDVNRIVHVDSNYPRDDPILAGYMQKQGQGVSTAWKSRYFILKERFLFYYKQHTDVIPIAVILLTPGFKVGKLKGDSKFMLELTQRKYRLRCANTTERSEVCDKKGSFFLIFYF